jgi:sodium/potassium/calcium exchanger 6
MNNRQRRTILWSAQVQLVPLLLLLLLLQGGTSGDTTLVDHGPQEYDADHTDRRHLKEGHLHHHFAQAMIQHDFANYSCQSIYQHTDRMVNEKNRTMLQCAYARTCNDGDGILLAERVFCQQNDNANDNTFSLSYPMQQFLILAAPLTLVLVIMFRILGSTAEEFFSPGLEMMSLELGFPERFAGVTLLALGNGAPDVASTVNAILNDRKTGYLVRQLWVWGF